MRDSPAQDAASDCAHACRRPRPRSPEAEAQGGPPGRPAPRPGDVSRGHPVLRPGFPARRAVPCEAGKPAWWSRPRSRQLPNRCVLAEQARGDPWCSCSASDPLPAAAPAPGVVPRRWGHPSFNRGDSGWFWLGAGHRKDQAVIRSLRPDPRGPEGLEVGFTLEHPAALVGTARVRAHRGRGGPCP